MGYWVVAGVIVLAALVYAIRAYKKSKRLLLACREGTSAIQCGAQAYRSELEIRKQLLSSMGWAFDGFKHELTQNELNQLSFLLTKIRKFNDEDQFVCPAVGELSWVQSISKEAIQDLGSQIKTEMENGNKLKAKGIMAMILVNEAWYLSFMFATRGTQEPDDTYIETANGLFNLRGKQFWETL